MCIFVCGIPYAQEWQGGGGVSIYVRNSLNSKLIREVSNLTNQIVVYAVNININPSRNLNVTGIYHPASSNVAEICDFLRDSILPKFCLNDLVVLVRAIFCPIPTKDKQPSIVSFTKRYRSYHRTIC